MKALFVPPKWVKGVVGTGLSHYPESRKITCLKYIC